MALNVKVPQYLKDALIERAEAETRRSGYRVTVSDVARKALERGMKR